VPEISRITNLLDSLGNAAAFSLLLTSCATLLPSYEPSFPGGAKQLARRMKYLQGVLYAGTFLLVTTILLKKSIYQWSLAFTSREEGAVRVAEKFISSLLAVEGGFYTLVLVAVYIPAAVILQRRANHLEELPDEGAEREKQLNEYDISFSFTESLPRLLAILGPVLAGPVGELLSRGL
jgi:hypothetical protein